VMVVGMRPVMTSAAEFGPFGGPNGGLNLPKGPPSSFRGMA
jgi:hypothetical protein